MKTVTWGTPKGHPSEEIKKKKKGQILSGKQNKQTNTALSGLKNVKSLQQTIDCVIKKKTA